MNSKIKIGLLFTAAFVVLFAAGSLLASYGFSLCGVHWTGNAFFVTGLFVCALSVIGTMATWMNIAL